jgi:hypothetical protein
VHWWLGDWLIYGEKHFGGTKYQEAMEKTGFKYGTLRNDKYVAQKVSYRYDKLRRSKRNETPFQETLLGNIQMNLKLF